MRCEKSIIISNCEEYTNFTLWSEAFPNTDVLIAVILLDDLNNNLQYLTRMSVLMSNYQLNTRYALALEL